MQNYQMQLKQLVDFPRCRIYREFVQSIIKDRSIRTMTANTHGRAAALSTRITSSLHATQRCNSKELRHRNLIAQIFMRRPTYSR